MLNTKGLANANEKTSVFGKIPLVLMGSSLPGLRMQDPLLSPPINVSGNFLACMSEGGGDFSDNSKHFSQIRDHFVHLPSS